MQKAGKWDQEKSGIFHPKSVTLMLLCAPTKPWSLAAAEVLDYPRQDVIGPNEGVFWHQMHDPLQEVVGADVVHQLTPVDLGQQGVICKVHSLYNNNKIIYIALMCFTYMKS